MQTSNRLFLFQSLAGTFILSVSTYPRAAHFYKVGKNMNFATPITFKQFCAKSRMWNTYQYHVSHGSARFWAFVIPVMGEWIWCLFYYLRELRRLYDDPYCTDCDMAIVDKTFALACERFGKKVVF